MLSDLIEVSKFAARHPDWVQGGGGNCSVKLNGQMWIKASGYFLEEVSRDGGYAVLEMASGKVIDPRGPKPSLEAPLHSLLGTYVIHTHPIPVVALVSSFEGAENFRKIFPENHFHWVEYAAPGRALYETVRRMLDGKNQSSLGLFLQNHGLFVSAQKKEEAFALHLEIISRLEKFFGAESALDAIMAQHFLTPDHAVYGCAEDGKGMTQKQMKAREETLFLVGSALAHIRKKGWRARWLDPEEVAKITEMEEEKYRKSLWGKA